MKTVTKDGKVKRVKDSSAPGFIKLGWAYCPKSVFKSKQETDSVARLDPVQVTEVAPECAG